MAEISVKISDIDGESQLAGHEGELPAVALRDAIEIGIASSQSSGVLGAGGSFGKAKHSNVLLVRYRDSSSPKLAEACSSGRNLGEVTVHFFRNAETGVQEFLKYTLGDVIVARVEYDTQDSLGTGFQPHLAVSSRGLPVEGPVGLGSLLAPVVAASNLTQRAFPQPMTGAGRGAAANRELERVWLNFNTVSWTYTPYLNGMAQGTVEKGYSIVTGQEV